jgi:hypothetical protein
LGSVIGNEVVFSLDRRFRAPVVRRFVVSLIFSLVLFLAGGSLVVAAIILAVVAALSAVTYLWRGRFRTVLRHDGIRIHGYFNHFVPWAEVAGFDVVGYGAPRSMNEEGLPIAYKGRWSGRFGPGGRVTRLATVSVIRVNGKRSLLRAPWVTAWSFDPEFDDKVAVMQRWWREHSVPQGPVY